MSDIKSLCKTIDLKNLAKRIFIVFVILQPLFDIYMSLFDEKISIMSTSLATIVRLLMVFIMTLFIMIETRKKKFTLFFVLYLFAILVYTAIHHFNANGFSVKLAKAEYNLLGELLYIARMTIPAALIYVIYNIKLRYKDIKLMICSASGAISSVIIISNLLKFGYVAYALNKVTVSNNMISWFTGSDVDWRLLTCRGLFQRTNQISGLMLIILPVLLHICFKEKKIKFWILPLLHIIAMINLGTRIASVGGILVLSMMVFLYVIENIIYKENFRKQAKNAMCFLFVAVFITVIFFQSPIIKRSSEGSLFGEIGIGGFDDMIDDDSEIDDDLDDDLDDDSEIGSEGNIEKKRYIKENYDQKGVHRLFIIEAYPYEQDIDFWYNLLKNVPSSEYYGNRNLRGFIIDRILERDGRFSNYLFGISFTRSSSFIWPERDIETHFDALGVIGVILFIGPYFACAIIGIWFFFKRFKENLKVSKCVYMIGLVLGLMVGYFSGHIINEVFPFVYLSLIAGVTLTNALNPELDEE